MSDQITISGRMTGPTSVELDEPVTGISGAVQVVLRSMQDATSQQESVFDFLRRLPQGTRTREEIDQQIRDERDAWGDRR